MKFHIRKLTLLLGFFSFSLYLTDCTKTTDPLEGWGDKVTVVTGNSLVPSTTAVDISNSTITCRISTLTGKERGICWSDSNNNISVSKNKASSGSGTGSFNTSLTNLLPGKTYYYRAYIILNPPSAALYGEIKSFKTPATCPPTTTSSTSAISYTTATTGGNVLANGGADVTARGVVISTSNPSPAIGSGTNYPSGSNTGAFTVSLTGLNPGTVYYVRAYATNSAGTCYGNVVQFTTLAVTCPPVNTSAASNIQSNTAVTGGDVTADGGASVTAKGVVISSTNGFPALGSGTNFPGGANTGPFTVNLTGLNPGTLYYIRAYATNAAGTCYGNTLQFTTVANCPTVTTSGPSNIQATTATTGGNVTSDGGANITSRGVVVSTTNTSPSIGSGTNYTSGSGTGAFTVNLAGLSPATVYYVRAYATNAAGSCYGNTVQFTTDAICPTVTTTAASNIQTTTATAGGNVTASGGASVTARGVVISTSNSAPAIGSGTNFPSGSNTGPFTVNLTGLNPGTVYYVRAYATNAAGTCYGNSIQFTTDANCPTVTTSAATSILYTTAITGGNVTDNGGATVTSRGIVISSSNASPTLGSGTNYPSGANTGSFTVNLTGLSPNTVYYVRAYATNAAGTCYGSTIQFRTQTVTCPNTITSSATSITQTTASTGGNVTADGGSAVTARGVVISASNTSPAIGSGTNIQSGASTGSFTVNLSGLSPNTLYYVRAYATNAAGTCYGSTIQFRTESITCPPTSTNSASAISYTSATTGGTITADGGATVTTRGVVFSSSNSTPALGSGTNISSGTNTGSFTVNLTGLIQNTVYYLRAYATNAAGTCYGNTIVFRTLAISCPIVITNSASSIQVNSAIVDGNIPNDGGATVTARGIVISSTNSMPAIGSATNYPGGTGSGILSVFVGGLSANTRYYARAYATNAAGTCYGSVIQFQTKGICPTVQTRSMTRVNSNTAILGGNVLSEGSSPVTAKGVIVQIGSGSQQTFTLGSGPGSYSTNFSGFVAGQTYRVTAYATNSAGTCYGNQIQFIW